MGVSLEGFATIAILVAAVLYHVGAVQGSQSSRLWTDAAHVYLPGAEKLISLGLDFFSTPDSYRSGPLNFIWPALFGARAEAIMTANVGLSVVILLLVFLTARLPGGRVGGVAAATLYAVSPLVMPLFTTLLSEPLFLAGTILWIYGTLRYVYRNDHGLYWGVAGGVISILTRPLWMTFIVIALPALALMWKLRPEESAWRKLTLVHGAILIPVAAWCLHNALEFGLPGVSTGSGTALYLGNHPLTLGVEPQFLMFDYDVQSMLIPWGGDNLSIGGDSALRAIGWSMIWDRSLSEQFQWFIYKLGTVLFFTKADLAPELYSVRALRVFEWCFAVYGLFAIRSRPLRWWIAGAVAAQVAQLTVVLYNQRYSVGSLELWLIVLTGCGVGRLLVGLHARAFTERGVGTVLVQFDRKEGTRLLARAAVLAIVAAGIGIAHWHRRLSDPLVPGIDHAPTRELLKLDEPPINTTLSKNVLPLPNGAYFVFVDEGLFVFDIPAPASPDLRRNKAWSLAMTIVPPDGKNCHGGWISYESLNPRPDVPIALLPIEFKGDGNRHRYAISATYPLSPLFVASEGFLKLRPFCPKNTQIAIHEVALVESTAPTYYLSRVKLP